MQRAGMTRTARYIRRFHIVKMVVRFIRIQYGSGGGIKSGGWP